MAELEWFTGRLDAWTSEPEGAACRLVFVCHGNINRSAFAQGVARRQGVPAVSVGLSIATGTPAFETTVACARVHGVDLSEHRATSIDDHPHTASDLYIVMEVRHAHRLVARGVPARRIRLLGHWARPRRIHIHDPHTLDQAYFETCLWVIDSAVVRLIDGMGMRCEGERR